MSDPGLSEPADRPVASGATAPARADSAPDSAPEGGLQRADAANELVDRVDEEDRVLERVSRGWMRRQRLGHRAVYIVVLDGADRVVVHQRAAWKDVWPGAWDVAFGGVLNAGEGYDAAARRELAEEAGLDGLPLIPLGAPFRYRDHQVDLHGRAYWVRTDRTVRAIDGEVEALAKVPVAELALWAAVHLVCPDSRQCVVPLVQLIPLVGPGRTGSGDGVGRAARPTRPE